MGWRGRSLAKRSYMIFARTEMTYLIALVYFETRSWGSANTEQVGTLASS